MRETKVIREEESALTKVTTVRNMTSGAPFLIIYSVVSTIVTVVLSILYNSCGKSTIEGNKGTIEQRTEIGLINQSYDNQECKCESYLPISILEGIVLIVLACTGIGLLIKATLHLRKWWNDKEEAKKTAEGTESTEDAKTDD